MKKRFLGKPFLAAAVSVAVLTAAAVPSVAVSYPNPVYGFSGLTYNLTQFDELGTSEDFMQVGDKVKTIADFSDSNKSFQDFSVDNGKASVKLKDGSNTGHKVLVLDSGNTSDFSGGDAADYLQFEIGNTSVQPLDMFFFNFSSSANYELKLGAGVSVNLYDFNSKSWSTVTTLSEPTLYQGAGPCLQIPAGFKGIVRIPVLGFSGGNSTDDNFVLRDNLVNRLQIYVQSPGFAVGTTPEITFDNFQWLLCGYNAETSVRPANNTIYKLKFDKDQWPSSDLPFYDLTIPLARASSGASYIQFRVNNTSTTAFEMFFIKLYADGYVMELQEGQPYTYIDLTNDGLITDCKVEGSSTLNKGTKLIKVPAHSSGYIRIPLTSFSGGNNTDDQWVVSNNTVYAINMYAELSDRSKWHNVIVSDFCWVDSDKFFLCDGDVNGDGIADVLDVVRAKKVAAGDNKVKYRAAGLDVRNDGIIKAEDIAQVRKVLLK